MQIRHPSIQQSDLVSKPNAGRAMSMMFNHHYGIARRYTGEPYEFHPRRVVDTLLQYGVYEDDILAAALLHDCCEDADRHGNKMTLEFVRDRTNYTVMRHVHALTEPTNGNRATRQAAYAQQMAQAATAARCIKFADIIDNVTGLAELDPKYAPRYLAEKAEFIQNMTEFDKPSNNSTNTPYRRLYEAACHAVNKELRALGIAYAAEELRIRREEEMIDVLATVIEARQSYSDWAMF